MRYEVAGFISAVVLACPAFAGDEVLYAPAPNWIAPVDLDAAIDADEPLVALDAQVRLEDGTVHSTVTWPFAWTAPRR